MRRARDEAGLTQAALAHRLKKSQTLIARAEIGELRVSERYVKAVLRACKLPTDWPGVAKPRRKTLTKTTAGKRRRAT